jgi:hypothetical protein
MRSQHISGTPRKCLNRNCTGVFTKESHLGYLPKSELEVYAVMRCPKCRDTFMVNQGMHMAHEYYERLPRDPLHAKRNGLPITIEEMRQVNQKLNSDPKALKSLFEADAPGDLRDET